MKKYVQCPICDAMIKEDAKASITVRDWKGNAITFCNSCSANIWEASMVGHVVKD